MTYDFVSYLENQSLGIRGTIFGRGFCSGGAIFINLFATTMVKPSEEVIGINNDILPTKEKQLTCSNYFSVLQEKLGLSNEGMKAREKYIRAKMYNSGLIKEDDLFRLMADSEELNMTKEDSDFLNSMRNEEKGEYEVDEKNMKKFLEIKDKNEIKVGNKLLEDESSFRVYDISERNRVYDRISTSIKENNTDFSLSANVGNFVDNLNNYFQDNEYKERFLIHGCKLRAHNTESMKLKPQEYNLKSYISILYGDFFKGDFGYLFPQKNGGMANWNRAETSPFSIIIDSEDSINTDGSLKIKYVIMPKERGSLISEFQKNFPKITFANRENIIQKMEENEPELKRKEVKSEPSIGDIYICDGNIYDIYKEDKKTKTIGCKNINTGLTLSSVNISNLPKNRMNIIGCCLLCNDGRKITVKSTGNKICYEVFGKNKTIFEDRKIFIERVLNGTYKVSE